MTEQDWKDLAIKAGTVFTPATPINKKALFAGRTKQVRQVVDVCNQRGQHAIIFGERGVGKTSLANTLTEALSIEDGSDYDLMLPRINCVSTDNYSDIWKRIFEQIEVKQKVNRIGYKNDSDIIISTIADFYNKEKVSPDDVRQTLLVLSQNNVLVFIIDEFDRIEDIKTKTAIADTIKTFSDHAIKASMILVGVADAVEELIKEHFSIERALVQIQMPRMSREELHEILEKGLQKLGMTINDKSKNRISLLSQGLPHYTHALGLHSTRNAIDNKRMNVTIDDVELAINRALDESQHTIKSSYHKAILSTRKKSIYPQVLLACALARPDEFGYFAPADVRNPLSKIMGKSYDIPSFSRHLHDFCGEIRERVLRKTGAKHHFKYRFRNPLMQPYVIMQGFANKLIDKKLLEEKYGLF
ncbi:MAG: ATP-binding protein [Nitrospirota bacterium]